MTKSIIRTLTIGASFALALSAISPAKAGSRVTSSTLPTGKNVVAGAIQSFDRSTRNELKITQSSNRAIIEWDAFDIGHKAKVNIVQPSQSAWTVNRVVSKGISPTKILGKLSANGQVMVLDPNGVIFGRRSRVDVNGIIVSTGDINDKDFMNGTNRIAFESTTGSRGTRSRIDNAGTITIGKSGIAAFVAPWVRNRGTINANLGKVTLSSAEKFTVDLYGDKLVELDTGVKTRSTYIENRGKINADGGTVELSIAQAENIVNGIINMRGVINAATVGNVDGKIVLSNPNTPDKRQRHNVIRIADNKRTALNTENTFIEGTTDSRANRYVQKEEVKSLKTDNPYPKETIVVASNTVSTSEIKDIDPTHRTKQISKRLSAVRAHTLDITITQYPHVASLNSLTPHASPYND